MANILIKLVTTTFLGTTLATVINANPAFAIRLDFFSQFSGFTVNEGEVDEGKFPGGSLTGTLTGEDLDMDEILQPTEITDFLAEFKSADENLFPSFTQKGKEVIIGSPGDMPMSFFGFGSQTGNYEFSTFSSIDNGGVFGTIKVLFGGLSGFNSISVTCVDEPLPDKCTSPPFNEGSFGTGQSQGFTFVAVPEPSIIGALTGFAVLSLGGFVKKKKLRGAGFNGRLLK